MYPQRSVMTCGLATALEPPHFNHAPVRGATGASFSRRSRAGSFNPRTRVGCDRSKSWGVPRRSCFNPRTRVGCDSANREFPARARLFQSTHPRGVRRLPRCRQTRRGHVSIHAPAWGATPYFFSHTFALSSFNPRTRVGCDASPPTVICPCACFNPRTRVGCDNANESPFRLMKCFNPRTRVGCDCFHVLSSRFP